MPRKLLALAAILAMLATTFEADALVFCTAANPNANVIESTPTSAFTVHGDGTVTHGQTGLMWKQCAQGQSGAGCATGAATALTWSAALAAAAADTTAGYSDWRLPNKKELESIVENCGYNPSINQTVFPATPASYFWSGSSYVPDPANAWLVLFDDGLTGAGNKVDSGYVRLVRGGQLFDSFDAQGDVTPPVLSAAGVSGTTAAATTLSATSDEAATGYWIVVPQGSAAPTAAEVKAGADYGAVTLAASGNGAMTAATPQTFSVTGLSAATAYDLYVAAEDSSSNHNLTPTATKVQFSTQAVADLAVTNSDTPDPVMAGSNLAYTVTVTNSGPDAAAFASWSDTLPAGTTFVSLAAAGGWSCTTPAVGASGTVTCNIASQPVGSAAFTLTLAVAPGTAAGTVISNTASATSAATDPSPGNNSSTATTTVAAPVAAISYTAASATGTGNITASFTGGGAGCGYTVNQFIPLTGHGASPPAGSAPAGVSFPHALFDFTTGGCTAGSTITMVITYPQPLPAGTVYWKYGPTPTDGSYHWYQLPAVIAGNTATFSITDGGLGDDDLTANGTIVDQGGPGGGGGGGAASIPTLSEWALLLLAGLMGLFGMGAMRRRKVPGL